MSAVQIIGFVLLLSVSGRALASQSSCENRSCTSGNMLMQFSKMEMMQKMDIIDESDVPASSIAAAAEATMQAASESQLDASPKPPLRMMMKGGRRRGRKGGRRSGGKKSRRSGGKKSRKRKGRKQPRPTPSRPRPRPDPHPLPQPPHRPAPRPFQPPVPQPPSPGPPPVPLPPGVSEWRTPGGLQSANWASSQGGLVVSTVQLPGKIAGPIKFTQNVRGPSSMNMVADPIDAASVYMSWTENLPFGRSSKNDEGKIHVSKLEIHPNMPAVLKDDKVFDGFVVAGGVDITEDGIVGTLCAKYVSAWIKEFQKVEDAPAPYGPMLLAVCEVDTKTMAKRTPWLIGRLWTTEKESNMRGNYPHSYWYSKGIAANGQLTYSRKPQMWTAFYGATIGKHSGYAMRSYKKDAPKAQPEYGTMPVPETEVEYRRVAEGDFNDGGRKGAGDHSAGWAMRYNPIVGDLYLQQHRKGPVFQQQYGFTPAQGVYVIGAFHRKGEHSGPILTNGEDSAWLEGSLRPCGEGMITAFISPEGSTCARVSKEGKIEKWRLIESSIGAQCHDWDKHDKDGLRMTRLATLGSPESEAKCGTAARFLMGYETEGVRRWLLEINGDCEPVSDPMDVTAHTSWPILQEWTTTRDGAVVWATAYPEGSYWPDPALDQLPAKEEKAFYPARPEEKDQGSVVLASPRASQWASVSVYWPSGKMPGRESFPPGPAPPPPVPPSDNRRRFNKNCRRRRVVPDDVDETWQAKQVR